MLAFLQLDIAYVGSEVGGSHPSPVELAKMIWSKLLAMVFAALLSSSLLSAMQIGNLSLSSSSSTSSTSSSSPRHHHHHHHLLLHGHHRQLLLFFFFFALTFLVADLVEEKIGGPGDEDCVFAGPCKKRQDCKKPCEDLGHSPTWALQPAAVSSEPDSRQISTK